MYLNVCSVLAIALIAVPIFAVDFGSMVKRCQAKTRINPGAVSVDSDGNRILGVKKPCFMACLYTDIGIVTATGKLNVEALKQSWSRKDSKFTEEIERCAGDPVVGDLCEIAVNRVNCILKIPLIQGVVTDLLRHNQ